MILQDDSKESPLGLWLLEANSNVSKVPHSAMSPSISCTPRSKLQGLPCLFLSKPLPPVSAQGPDSPRAGTCFALTVLMEPLLLTNFPTLVQPPVARK